MSPDQIAGLVALATVVKTIGTLPFGAASALIFFGPWVLMYFQARTQDRRAADHARQSDAMVSALREEFRAAVVTFERGHQQTVGMYENNVILVKNYERVTDEHIEHLRLNTEVLTRLSERIKPS